MRSGMTVAIIISEGISEMDSDVKYSIRLTKGLGQAAFAPKTEYCTPQDSLMY